MAGGPLALWILDFLHLVSWTFLCLLGSWFSWVGFLPRKFHTWSSFDLPSKHKCTFHVHGWFLWVVTWLCLLCPSFAHQLSLGFGVGDSIVPSDNLPPPSFILTSVWISDAFCLVGEATNPGPSLAISCCNPSGISGKESILMELPTGIINVAETHLSSISQHVTFRSLRSIAARTGRRLRILPGAPVALRP